MKSQPLFLREFGKPDPAVPNGIRFKGAFAQKLWAEASKHIGAGYYLNRFLFLFGEGLQDLRACLEAWSFLVPPAKGERMILGCNAYGSLLVLENADSSKDRVHLLDPFRVQYLPLEINFLNLIDHALPDGTIPDFLDDELYQAWVHGGEYLPKRYILGAQRPEPLGGEMVPANMQAEDLVFYYQSTGAIYADAISPPKPTTKKRPQKRPKAAKARKPKNKTKK